MKSAFGIALLSCLVVVCVLSMNLGVPGVVVAKSAGKDPQAATVRAEVVHQDPATAAKVEALRAAKRAGDAQRVRSLCEELGWTSVENRSDEKKDPSSTPHVVVRPELAGESKAGDKNAPGTDVLVNNPAWQSSNPAIAAAADGTLYAVLEDVRPGSYCLDFYYSVNDGYTWLYKYSLSGDADLYHPSVAIGEGTVNRLLVAYESGAGTAAASIRVFWEDLDTQATGLYVVESNPSGLYYPRICVDSPEYSNWWPYLTYTRGAVSKQDRYNLVFSRSTNYGDTWQAPVLLVSDVGADCEPDIDYGTAGLYLAYTKYVPSFENDVYVVHSDNLGTSWSPELALANGNYNEVDPRVAAVNGDETVVVAFTREYSATTADVEAYYMQDGSGIWYLTYLPYTSYSEAKVDLTTSRELGRIHAAFWSEHDIHYTWAAWDTPSVWSEVEVLNDGGTAALGIRPSVAVNPRKPQEGCVAWADTRVELQYNVFFDAAWALGDYLIILGNDGLYSAIGPLVEWKEQLGYNVGVITVDTIYGSYPTGDDAERIWTFLHDNAPFLKYVLLVGDIDQIPMRILYPDGNPEYPPSDPKHHNGLGYGTDYYYAEHDMINWDQDGDNRWGEFTDDAFDHDPDLFVGRLPFNDPAPVQAVCSNIVSFEQDTGAWKRNALLAHGFLFQPPMAGLPGSDCASMADYLQTNLLDPLSWTTTSLYEKGGVGASVFGCTAGLSQTEYENRCGLQNYGVVNCVAHGNGSGMSSVRWLADLNGSGACDLAEEWTYNEFSQQARIASHPAQSVVFLNGCSSAPIIGDDPAFAASPLRSRYLIRNPRHNLAFKDYLLGGAPAVIGSSAGSAGTNNWTSPSNSGSMSLNYYFYEFLLGLGMPVGEAFHYAQWAYVEDHELQREMRVFNYYGDPSLILGGIPTEKRGDPRLASQPLPGHLDPRAALALAGDWQQGAGAAKSGGAPNKAGQEAAIWAECAELPDCLTVTSLAATPYGLFGTGIAALDTSSTKGVIFRSANGWDPWSVTEIAGLLSARTVFLTDAGTLLVGGMTGSLPSDYHGIIYRSVDGGETWSEQVGIAGGLVTDICQDTAGKLRACCGLNGQIWSSVDDGVTWTMVVAFSGGPHLSSIMQASTGRFFATLEQYGALSIIESDNGDDSWYPVTGLADVVSAYEIVEVDELLYAGTARTDGGRVYRSTDLSGESWIPLDPFPPGARGVRSLALDTDGRIFAGVTVAPSKSTTRVYYMDPSASLWNEFGGGIDLADRVTTILPVPGTVFIGTGSFNGNLYRCAGLAVTGVPGDDATPSYEFGMEQNYPNPFNPFTSIAYELPRASAVTLGIYDVSGRRVRLLVDSAGEEAGRHEVTWDGRDGAGRMLPAGIYLYRLEAGALRETRRMVLVK